MKSSNVEKVPQFFHLARIDDKPSTFVGFLFHESRLNMGFVVICCFINTSKTPPTDNFIFSGSPIDVGTICTPSNKISTAFFVQFIPKRS